MIRSKTYLTVLSSTTVSILRAATRYRFGFSGFYTKRRWKTSNGNGDRPRSTNEESQDERKISDSAFVDSWRSVRCHLERSRECPDAWREERRQRRRECDCQRGHGEGRALLPGRHLQDREADLAQASDLRRRVSADGPDRTFSHVLRFRHRLHERTFWRLRRLVRAQAC